MGYVVIRVQVEGVPEYDEDQVAFVVDDNTTFSWRAPVVLGTPTINRVVTVMKESNLNNAPMEWQASKTSYELVNGFLMRRLHLEPGGFPTNTGKNPIDLDETVSLTSKCVALPFESVIVHRRTQRTMMMDHRLNVMTQAPYPDDMAALPNGIYITHAYTDMKPGSHQVCHNQKHDIQAYPSPTRQDRCPCCGIQCSPERQTFPRSAKKTGVRYAN